MRREQGLTVYVNETMNFRKMSDYDKWVDFRQSMNDWKCKGLVALEKYETKKWSNSIIVIA